jgi:hypothetical protein
MDFNHILAGTAKLKDVDTQTNGIATATIAAVTRRKFYITGVTISASAAPAAATYAQVLDGTTEIDRIQIPAAAFSVIRINYNHPLECTTGNKAEAILQALGTGVIGSITLHAFGLQD